MDIEINDIYNYKSIFGLLREHKWEEFKTIIINSKFPFDINMQDEQKNYFLTYAILYNQLDIVDILFEKNAKLDILDLDEKSILYIPIKFNYMDMLEKLLIYNKEHIGNNILEYKDKNYKIPLHYAIELQNIEAISILLKYSSSINMYDKQGYNAIHMAVYSRDINICEMIIKGGCDVNSRCLTGETALHIACNLQLYNIVNLLIESNIQMNTQDYDYELSAMHYAVNSNNKKIVKLLYNKGIDINMQDINGNTALHYTIINSDYESMIFMLQHNNINVNIWNLNGDTPMHLVLENINNSSHDYIEGLITKTNLTLQNNTGNTCLHYLVKLNLWKMYYDVLVNKKLDILLINSDNMSCIDLINMNDYDEFIEMVYESYYNMLGKSSGWTHSWENECVLNTNNKQECKKHIKNKIDNLIKKFRDDDKYDCHERTYPINKNTVCPKIYEGKVVKFCTFTGNTIDILCGVLYLLKRHTDACSVLTKSFDDNKQLIKYYNMLGIRVTEDTVLYDFELLWINYNLYINDNFYAKIKNCVKNNKRFIIIPLGIEMPEGSHANYIIYDVAENEIERFEPHGKMTPPGFKYNYKLLDELLSTKFKNINENIKYFSPTDFLPKVGLQTIDIHEKHNKHIGDPMGFCALWAIWYVDMRLTYKNINRSELCYKLMKSIRMQNISFKKLIRLYSEEITGVRDKIFKKANIDINKWINNDYTMAQYETILKNIKQIIKY
jgi:ankyrin repeat protein